MKAAKSYIFAVLVGVSLTIGVYETRRLVEDTSKALSLASATLNDDGTASTRRKDRLAESEAQAQAGSRRARANEGRRVKGQRSKAKRVEGQKAEGAQVVEKPQRRGKFKVSEGELKLLKQRRREREEMAADLRMETEENPLPVGRIRKLQGRRGEGRVQTVDAELLGEDQEILDTGLPLLPE
ncbi:MAG: hypothetical protein GWP91_21530 [Rhodobacterales bacterium]|nr:hypothetical protein [Rhodobacterales bacterium]